MADDTKKPKQVEKVSQFMGEGYDNVLGNITPEQAKTLLQSDAHHLLQLNPKERKEHYKNVQEKQGQKALEKLLAEVKKQRTKSNELEM